MTVGLPAIKTSSRETDAQETAGGTGVDGNINAACGQEQNCEGQNPMSDAATESRGGTEKTGG